MYIDKHNLNTIRKKSINQKCIKKNIDADKSFK